ncbi:plasmid stabilization protein [Streptomyces sp. NPDC005925]|uniref:plasmid stabilization protein n=1 Tax=Streptomyces sp. NPDC005925 TaxID=3157172 RepID=UPI0033DB8690
MPSGSSSQRERQYEHIKESAEDRGASTGRAKEMAARTVNKQRSRTGEAHSSGSSRGGSRKSSSSRQGGGSKSSGGGGSRSGATRDELYQEARRKGIEGRSSMNKQQLARALGH